MRKLVGLLAAVGMLAIAPEARATAIGSIDFDVWVAGSGGTTVYAPLLSDVFSTVPSGNIGSIDNYVLLNKAATEYAYVHYVTPSINNISEFNTAFDVIGFTGTAGWQYSSALAAGGSGTASDFSIKYEGDGTIDWETNYLEGPVGHTSSGFDAGETILFYYVSTNPPGLGDYNIIDGKVGTATSYAPVPEPGSMALLGSGLVGLVTAVRRRRRQNS